MARLLARTAPPRRRARLALDEARALLWGGRARKGHRSHRYRAPPCTRSDARHAPDPPPDRGAPLCRAGRRGTRALPDTRISRFARRARTRQTCSPSNPSSSSTTATWTAARAALVACTPKSKQRAPMARAAQLCLAAIAKEQGPRPRRAATPSRCAAMHGGDLFVGAHRGGAVGGALPGCPSTLVPRPPAEGVNDRAA